MLLYYTTPKKWPTTEINAAPLESSSTTAASGFLAGVSSEHQSAVQATIRENTERGPRMGKVLRQVAWGAARTKRRYLRIKCHRLAAYRGKKRDLPAVAHNILVIGWVGILGLYSVR